MNDSHKQHWKKYRLRAFLAFMFHLTFRHMNKVLYDVGVYTTWISQLFHDKEFVNLKKNNIRKGKSV